MIRLWVLYVSAFLASHKPIVARDPLNAERSTRFHYYLGVGSYISWNNKLYSTIIHQKSEFPPRMTPHGIFSSSMLIAWSIIKERYVHILMQFPTLSPLGGWVFLPNVTINRKVHPVGQKFVKVSSPCKLW